MQISILIIWCCCFVLKTVVSLETISNSVNAVTHTHDGDRLLIKGHFMNSSYIKTLSKAITTNRTIQKVHVHVVNTFYVDDGFEMRGIGELYILAKKWIISREATFDLSGLNGRKPAISTVKGSAGNPGEAGKNGANFFGLATEIINGELLTVKLNGGNGGEGQDGTASDNVRVIFDTRADGGESGWFSTADLRTYYQHYFQTGGYNPDMSYIDDYNSFYTLLSNNKEASFLVTLHPSKCCGTSGMGGEGGRGGRSGTPIMKIGHSKVTGSPKFLAKEGCTGNSGMDASPCRNTALKVRVSTKLEAVGFLSIPLHHSFTSQISEVGYVNSSKCPIHFVKGKGAALVSEQHKIEADSAIIEYETFLLEEIKNEAIDLNSKINSACTVDDFTVIAIVLEKRFLHLRKHVNLKQLYERLYERIQALENRAYCDTCTFDESSKNDLSRLNFILSSRLSDFPRQDLVFRRVTDFKSEVSSIKRSSENYTRDSRVYKQHTISQLQFNVNVNDILLSYFTINDLYKSAFFPFAGEFLGTFQLLSSSSSLESDEDTNKAFSTVTSNLNTIIEHTEEMNAYYSEFLSKTTLDNDDPLNCFYKWKYSEVRNEIRQLFAGEKVRLFADIKRSEVQLSKQFNAFRFSEINLVFRSSNKTINDELNEVLSTSSTIRLNHTGESDIRCNDDFYRITTGGLEIIYCPSYNHSTRSCVGDIYNRYQHNYPALSPYTHWDIELKSKFVDLFPLLAKFIYVDFDIELHCTGKYLDEDADICYDDDADVMLNYSYL